MVKLPGRWRGGNSLKLARKLPTICCDRNGEEGVAIPPVVVAHAFLAPFGRIGAEVEEDRRAQRLERLAPHVDTGRVLHHEVHLEAIVADGQQVAVVAEVEELPPLARALAGEEIALVVAVEMDLEGRVAGLCSRPAASP